MEEVKVGGKYRHFKGKEYKVLHVARDCENPERMLVIYQALYDSELGKNQIWTREVNDFLSYKEDNGEKIKRFKLIE
jgi:hypothetical protein